MAEKDYIRIENGVATITLSRPFKTDAGTVSEIAMREPTVADDLAADDAPGSDLQKEIRLFANLCQLAPDDIKRLPRRDYRRLQTASLVFQD